MCPKLTTWWPITRTGVARIARLAYIYITHYMCTLLTFLSSIYPFSSMHLFLVNIMLWFIYLALLAIHPNPTRAVETPVREPPEGEAESPTEHSYEHFFFRWYCISCICWSNHDLPLLPQLSWWDQKVFFQEKEWWELLPFDPQLLLHQLSYFSVNKSFWMNEWMNDVT